MIFSCGFFYYIYFVDSDSTKDIYITKYNFPEDRVIVSVSVAETKNGKIS